MAIIITKPIATHILEYTLQVNQFAMDKILPTYPFYLQNNLSRDVNSIEAITMFTWIDSVRNNANVAKAEISIATDLVSIRATMARFFAALILIV